MKIIKQNIVLLLIFILPVIAVAQQDSVKTKYNPYKLNYFVDVPITVAGLLGSKYGTDYLRDREPKHPEEIQYLKPSDIWWFDRGATKQDMSKQEDYLNTSNLFLRFGFFGPALMYLDPKVRDIWLDYAMLHLENQAINSTLYLAGAIPVQRLRPFMYNTNYSLENKMGDNTTNSFFSGHVSVVASSTFLMVKVYYDLHPEAKNKLLFYGLASIPPAYTGYLRYKAAKHFPTDIITGFVLGAASGILVPELHKKKSRLKIYPVAMQNGAGVYAKISLN